MPVLRQMPRLLAGFTLLGFAVALMVRADLGLGPWDVLHQGIAHRTGIGFGMVTILVGAVVMAMWVPLAERVGIGTVLNVVGVGLVVELALSLLPDAPTGARRWAALLAGAALFGPGVALYLSCGLGAGPRDGLMTGLARRGWSIRRARTAVELAALGAGVALGGRAGIGTILYAATIGLNVQFFLCRWSIGHAVRADLTTNGACSST